MKKIAFTCLLWVSKPQFNYQILRNPWEVIISGPVQSEEIKRDPEMYKSAVWAGSGCMAVFPISGSSLIPPPGIVKAILLTRDCLYT